MSVQTAAKEPTRGAIHPIVWIAGAPERYVSTLLSLAEAFPHAATRVVCRSSADRSEVERLCAIVGSDVWPVTIESDWTPWRAIAAVPEHHHALLITDPVEVPRDIAVSITSRLTDLRVASLSFLSNAADFLSHPYFGTPIPTPGGAASLDSLNEAVRGSDDDGTPALVPIPWPTGSAVLLTATGRQVVGEITEALRPPALMAEFGMRAARRGFSNCATVSVYVRAVAGSDDFGSRLHAEELAALDRRHPGASVSREVLVDEHESVLNRSLAAVRVRCEGVRVLIDGTCLGPIEMGTQVQVVQLIAALTRHRDVQRVAVVTHGALPSYATSLLASSKVDVRPFGGGDWSRHGPADVLHRPYQPDGDTRFEGWEHSARRLVVTMQDTIAYQDPAYYPVGADWREYRRRVEAMLRRADSVVTVSDDVVEQLRFQGLPVPAERVHSIPNGTDHMTGSEPCTVPSDLLVRGWAGLPFVLVLGTDYAHKNRDLALRAWGEVRRRGHDVGLVMVGASTPCGSTRQDEALLVARMKGQREGLGRFLATADVSANERNWLLRHAAVVLYPTANEGFGLVPHEAAIWGTPTAAVRFGPLREVFGEAPALSDDWSVESLADSVSSLLTDPSLAARQVGETLRVRDTYSWDRTAELSVRMYRKTVAMVPRL